MTPTSYYVAIEVGRMESFMKQKFAARKKHGFKSKAQKKKEERKKKIWLIGSGILLLLAVLAGVAAWVECYMPSFERMDLNDYYANQRTDSDAPILILDDEVQEEGSFEAENTMYIPVDWVNGTVDSCFYADQTQMQMLLTDDTHIWMYYPWDTQYLENGESKTDTEIKVVSEEDKLYVKASFVAEKTQLNYSVMENPKRVWMWHDRECARIRVDTQLRYLSGIKSSILEDLKQGDMVFVCEEKEKWTRVQSMSGVVGYVLNKTLEETELDTSSSLTDTSSDAISESDGSAENANDSKSEKNGSGQITPICMVWHQTIGTDGLEGLSGYIEADLLRAVDVISPSWFTLSDNEGNMEYRGNSEYVELAHENGIQVWAMLDNLNIPVDTLAILSQTSARFHIEDVLVQTALSAKIDGINVDLESLTHEAAIHFVQFLRELAVKCHQNGIILSVDNPVPEGWNSYYNLTDQAKVADYIILMSYDEHWAGGEAGSTSSYAFTKNGIEMALKEVPSEKLINGIPFYTRVWNVENEESYAIGMNELDALFVSATDLQMDAAWDDDIRQVYVKFTKDGAQYQVWVEDISSLQWRLDLIKEHNLAGVSAWKLGFETALVWDTLELWKAEYSL